MAAITCPEKRPMQFVYQDGDGFVFLDAESDEPITLAAERVRQQKFFLTEGCRVEVILDDGKPIGLELPAAVELVIADKGPAGSAWLETGLKVKVPLSVDVGEVVAVDTRTGEYLHRTAK
jgi:elongation factor P